MGSINENSEEVKSFSWGTKDLVVEFILNEHGAPCIEQVHSPGTPHARNVSPYFGSASVPLNAIRINGQGHSAAKTSKSLVGGVLSGHLMYRGRSHRSTPKSECVDIVSKDDLTGIEAVHTLEIFRGVPVLRSYTTVRNTSEKAVIVKQASSLAIGGLTRGDQNWHRTYSVWEANNTWFREAQWQQRPLSDVGIDDIGLLQLDQGHRATMAHYGVSNRGSFSAEGHLPMGAISREDGLDSWLWQIEHNGSWRWEIGDWQDGLYLAAGGPNSFEHDWEVALAADEAFTSVPVAVCHVAGPLTDAFAVLNDYRRCLLRPHVDREELPVIFNDYMNCLMGDPTEAKVAALIEPAARSGAKYFVIDAGWYADDQDWWEDVGAWRPSSKRFPSGFARLMDQIKARGLVPGVWLEPEVIGIRSPVAKVLPEHAFFQLHGHRLEERGRYQLDFSQDAVREHMDGVVDGLVAEYGIGYFKFDYNIDVVSGSDAAGSPGAAHLAHQRAYLAWVAGLCQRHPALVVENCSSGGLRMDYAMLAVHTLQSTSDQQDPLLYAAIAAACPTAVVPEQSASWAYPQPQWSDETNAFTVVNALLGRVHLSGRPDLLSARQSALVDEGLRVYREHIRAHLCTSRPFWPLGLPRWHDQWLALGLSLADGSAVVAVWRRGGPTNTRFQLPPPLRHLRVATLLYPAHFEARLDVDGGSGSVRVEVPDVPCARVLKFCPS